MKQVDNSHYEFSKYMSGKRWISTWHQLSIVMSLGVKSVAEIGPGTGIFTAVLRHLKLDVTTIDVAEDLKPNVIASATDIPIVDEHVDVSVAFQVLEHMRYEESLVALSELGRISNKYVVLSLPNSERMISLQVRIPGLLERSCIFRRPFWKSVVHKFDGQHYWELNKKGFSTSRVKEDFQKMLPEYELVDEFRVKQNPYHHFFTYKRSSKINRNHDKL